MGTRVGRFQLEFLDFARRNIYTSNHICILTGIPERTIWTGFRVVRVRVRTRGVPFLDGHVDVIRRQNNACNQQNGSYASQNHMTSFGRNNSTLQFLEEIVECATSIRRLGWRGLTISATTTTTGISRFPLNRCTGHEELTRIPQIFLRHPFTNRLRALELCRCIKVAAVLASVEVGFALGALAFVLDINRRRNDRATQSAAQHFLKTRHLDWPRRFSGFGPARSTLRLFTRFFAFTFATIAVIILITALAVFSFHRRGFEKIPGALFKCFYGGSINKVTAGWPTIIRNSYRPQVLSHLFGVFP